MTTATKSRKTLVLRSKIRLTTSNGVCHIVTDSNPSRRCTAEVLDCGKLGYNVRIDRNGKPWKYAAAIKVATPEAAYEYAHEFGSRLECWDE